MENHIDKLSTLLLASDRQHSSLATSPPVQPFTFSPYGFGNSSLHRLISFAGQWFDRGSGSYPLGNGYRRYRPSLMRFVSPDLLSPFDHGGINAYAYCTADPINYVDSSGLMPKPLKSAPITIPGTPRHRRPSLMPPSSTSSSEGATTPPTTQASPSSRQLQDWETLLGQAPVSNNVLRYLDGPSKKALSLTSSRLRNIAYGGGQQRIASSTSTRELIRGARGETQLVPSIAIQHLGERSGTISSRISRYVDAVDIVSHWQRPAGQPDNLKSRYLSQRMSELRDLKE